jgi:hypothetical protein
MLIVYNLDKAIQGKQPMILILLLMFLHTNLLFIALQPLHNVYRFNAMLWYQTNTLQLSN